MAPNEFTSGIFKAVEPFVIIDRSGVMPDYDKFKPKMDKEALSCATKYVAYELGRAEINMRKDLTTELSIRPYHTSLLYSIGSFVKHSKEEISQLKDDIACVIDGDDLEDDADEDLGTFLISSGGSEKGPSSLESGSTSSNDGRIVDHEVSPQGEDNIKELGRTDFRIFIHDRSPFKLKLPEKRHAELESERLGALVESKFLTEEEAIFQAAGYARAEVLRNLQNLHLKPVYLLVLTDSRWTYAILDVRGSVCICNNLIEEDSMSDLLELERLRFVGKSYVHSQLGELRSMLDENMKLLKDKRYKKVYPRKKYLVGRLYLSKQWYDLPSIRRVGSFASPHSFRFFEGLLRIAVGDKAVKWTPKDVTAAYELKSKVIDCIVRYRSGLHWDDREPAGKRARLYGQGEIRQEDEPEN